MLKNNTLLKIFNIKDFDKTTIEKCQYLDNNEGGLNSFKINEEGFNKIKEYLENFQYSFNELIFLFSLQAYDSCKRFKIIKELLEKIVKSHKAQIFDDLNEYKIDTRCFDKINVALYESFLDIKDTANFLDHILSNIVFTINRYENIYKIGEENKYGIEYLMKNLFQYYKNDFEEWFFKTKNNNLKLIFVYSCFDWICCDAKWILNKNNIDSKIVIVRIINILMFFWVDKHNLPLHILDNNTIKFEDILTYKNIPDNEKLCYLFYYVNNNFGMLNPNNLQKEKENEKKLLNILKKFNKILQNITELDIKNILNFNDIVVFYIISSIKDINKRNGLFEFYIEEYLEKNIKQLENNMWDINIILKANVYGMILKKTQSEHLIQKVKDNFVMVKEIASIPYIYYTNTKLWTYNISKMMYYLIVIFIFYSRKNKSEIKKYKKEFVKTKSDLKHYFDRLDKDKQKESYFGELLRQIK